MDKPLNIASRDVLMEYLDRWQMLDVFCAEHIHLSHPPELAREFAKEKLGELPGEAFFHYLMMRVKEDPRFYARGLEWNRLKARFEPDLYTWLGVEYVLGIPPNHYGFWKRKFDNIHRDRLEGHKWIRDTINAYRTWLGLEPHGRLPENLIVSEWMLPNDKYLAEIEIEKKRREENKRKPMVKISREESLAELRRHKPSVDPTQFWPKKKD